jgi:hypothetical protein
MDNATGRRPHTPMSSATSFRQPQRLAQDGLLLKSRRGFLHHRLRLGGLNTEVRFGSRKMRRRRTKVMVRAQKAVEAEVAAMVAAVEA